MEYEDERSISLRKYEWETIVNYTRKWIQHVYDIDLKEEREDDEFIHMFNDTARLDAICKKIADDIK